MPRDLGSALRAARLAAGRTQRQVAEDVGVSAAYISQIETGQRSPTVTTVRQLAAAVRIEVSCLFGEEIATDPAAVRLPNITELITLRGLAEVEQQLSSPTALRWLTTAARQYLASENALRLGAYRGVAEEFVDVVEAYSDGTFRSIRHSAIHLLTAALGYLVDPDDVWSDTHPHGHIDDVAVLAFVRSLVVSELLDYERWVSHTSVAVRPSP